MRYDRQMILPEIGEEGQLKLKKAKSTHRGCGRAGLSHCPLSGRSRRRLHRTGRRRPGKYQQLATASALFENELDKPKAVCAAERLSALNSGISILPLFHPADRGKCRQYHPQI